MLTKATEYAWKLIGGIKHDLTMARDTEEEPEARSSAIFSATSLLKQCERICYTPAVRRDWSREALILPDMIDELKKRVRALTARQVLL